MLAVLAPDKFKGSLTAREVADALAEGLSARADLHCKRMPIADGGDGTVVAFLAAGWEHVPVEAPGPTGVPQPSGYAIKGRSAVVELAAVSGLTLLPAGRPDPLGANTVGLGVLIKHALDHGARDIIIGLGGSASTDGGAGMLHALGARILDADGIELPAGGGALSRAARLDLDGLHPGVAAASFLLASDVGNPLLGPDGATAVYGPQKGASVADLAVLTAAMERWATVVGVAVGRDCADRPGAGAAGGTGFAALAVLGARQRPGIDVVLELIGFADALAGADLVITGEGSLDGQSLHGKAPMGVLAAAGSAGVPVFAVAGRAELSRTELAAAGFAGCYTLAELEPDAARSIADAAALLRTLGGRIAASLP